MTLDQFLVQYPNTAAVAAYAIAAVFVVTVAAALAAIRWHFCGGRPTGCCGVCDGRSCRPERCEFAVDSSL